jgi:hypothetical protein
MKSENNSIGQLLISAFEFVDLDNVEYVTDKNINSILSLGEKKSFIKSDEIAEKLLAKIKSTDKDSCDFDYGEAQK